MKPLASFAGHCFKGTLAGGKDTDEHCFQWIYGGTGGILRGTVEPAEGVLVFPAAIYVAGGQAMTLRVRWTLEGDGYEAWSEREDKGAWTTMFRVRMAKSS